MATTIFKADGSDANGGNGNGTNGMPWQVRAVAFFGVPSAIALFLVYVLAVDVRTDSKNAAATAASMRSELAAHQTHTEQLHANIESYMRVQLLLMRQVCVNSAKSAEDRRTCFQP